MDEVLSISMGITQVHLSMLEVSKLLSEILVQNSKSLIHEVGQVFFSYKKMVMSVSVLVRHEKN